MACLSALFARSLSVVSVITAPLLLTGWPLNGGFLRLIDNGHAIKRVHKDAAVSVASDLSIPRAPAVSIGAAFPPSPCPLGIKLHVRVDLRARCCSRPSPNASVLRYKRASVDADPQNLPLERTALGCGLCHVSHHCSFLIEPTPECGSLMVSASCQNPSNSGRASNLRIVIRTRSILYSLGSPASSINA